MVRLALSLAALSVSSVSLAQQVQKPGLVLPPGASGSRNQVRDIFVNAFSAYQKFAFSHDDLSPVSRSFSDGRNGWGATVVDSLGTMKIMGLDDLYQLGLNYTSQIDFSKSNTPDTVSVFESTIRYLGGLLSAYELNGKKDQVLVDKAKQLTDKLMLGFNGDSPIPYGFIDFSTNQPLLQITNIAEAGTLAVEWGELSKYTGNPVYRQLTEGALKQIASLPGPLPGLAAQGIDPKTGQFVGGFVSWGGGSDSYFEYLLKFPRLFPDADPLLVKTWQTAVDSSIQYLVKVSTVGNWTYLASLQSDRQIRHVGSHLKCFSAGNWILGGKLLQNETILDLGLKMADACWNVYASTQTGFGPEAFGFISQINGQPPNGTDDGNFTNSGPITPDQLAYNAQHGNYIITSDYILRPEVLESNFYAWRVTGDLKYFNNAQTYVQNLIKVLEVPGGVGGVSGLFDVNKQDIGPSDRVDDTESFFFAEVMKYLYLTFDDPNNISLDTHVFNTECQPFEAPPLTNFATWAAKPTSPVPFNSHKMENVPLPQYSFVPQVKNPPESLVG